MQGPWRKANQIAESKALHLTLFVALKNGKCAWSPGAPGSRQRITLENDGLFAVLLILIGIHADTPLDHKP